MVVMLDVRRVVHIIVTAVHRAQEDPGKRRPLALGIGEGKGKD